MSGSESPTSRVHPRVLVVGSGLRFLSGISVYTHQLVTQLGEDFDVSALLVRNLVPRALYPGGQRVGKQLSSLSYAGVPHQEGLDWYWVGSLRRAFRFLREQQPDVVVLQWWTAATAHTYLALAAYARRQGARVVMEYHEVQDPGEAGMPLLRRYGGMASRRLARMLSGAVVHHEHDLELLRRVVPLDDVPVRLAPHPPYSYLQELKPARPPELGPPPPAGDRTFRMLFFGVIRPRKGFETIAEAFARLPREVAEQTELLVVGECWEGLQAAVDAATSGTNGDRVRVVGRYVTDEEAAAVFRMADVVLLPYTESSSSGPLAIATSFGLPVLLSDLPGLRSSAGGYAGATPVAATDPEAWATAFARAYEAWRQHGTDLTPTGDDWGRIRQVYRQLVEPNPSDVPAATSAVVARG